jgi:hypothetical protein
MTVNPARHGPFPGHLAPDGISAYAAATGDDTASVVAGCAVPATFPVILVFAAVETARGDVPPEAWKRVRGGVHGEHEIVLHRPLEPGEALTTWSRISGMRTSRAGTRVAVHLGQLDCDGLPAVEQWWTMVLLGLDGLPDLGTMPAEHRFPGAARANGLGSTTFHVDAERHAATRRCPATGRNTISTSRRRAPQASTSCSRTACARWRSAHIACSPCSVSTTPAGYHGWRSDSPPLPRWDAT